MSGFTISWTHEAEDWLQYQRESSMEAGFTFNERVIYTPSDEEKSVMETELKNNLSEILIKYAKEIIKLEKNTNYHATMKIYFECKGGFYVRFWHEPGYEATDFMIMNKNEDTETARIIFEDIPSIEYSSKYDYI